MQVTRIKDAYTLMRATDESRHAMVFYARKVMRPAIALGLFLSCFAVLLVVEREAAARAAAPVTLSSGLSASRATIPVSINGRRASCILDTGSSAILVSP